MAETNQYITPNLQQISAIEHPPGPLMILAGAGTGKTFTLENRIVYLIQHYKVDPNHILAITYTEKAARELKSRIVGAIGPSAHSLTVNTFHSFCFKLLKEFGEGHLPQLFDESEAIHMLLERFDEFEFESDEFPLNPQLAVTESFIPFFNRLRDELIDPSKMVVPEPTENGPLTPEIANQLKDLQGIYPFFKSWKKQLNVIDYGDMIESAFRLLQSNKRILKKVQNQYRHLIVDEFQDNNFALNEIIGLIAGNRQSITVVGDDDQVIYSFRGANSYNIQAFKDRYKSHPGYRSVALEKNFRSTQPILDIANESIQHNVDRMKKTLTSNHKGPAIKPIRFWGDEPNQIEFIIREILDLSSSGTSYIDMAILCRTHSKTKLVIQSLQRAGIPVQTKWPGFFQIPEIRTLIAWCQVIGNGKEADAALYRLIEITCGSKLAYSLFSQYNSRDESPRLKLIQNNKTVLNQDATLKSLFQSIRHFQQDVQKKSAGEMIWNIVSHLNIIKHCAKTYSIDDHFILLNVGDLLKRSQAFTRRNKKNHSLAAFNLYINAIMNTRGLPSIHPPVYRQLDAVNVSTVHGVKGGEFPVVFLPFQRSNSFPLNPKPTRRISRPPDDWLSYQDTTDLTPKEHHYQEERRLFYVAVTRAKETLYILAPEKATSRFIKELPDDLMEDHLMSNPDSKIRNHSDFKIKYEQKLQKALSREDYAKVKDYSDALSVIDKLESGGQIDLGDSPWEIELKSDLVTPFQPPEKEKINLSASAIDTYKQCPLKFRLSRMDGIPQTASKPELIFGNIIHAVLQRFHEKDKPLSKERILRLLDEEWKKGDFDYTVREEKFKEQGSLMLIRYCYYVEKNPPIVIAREEKFTFEMGNITIRGAIDRIDKTENGTAIVDYKTSKTSTSAKSNLQLAIYSMFLEQSEHETMGGLPAEASLHFLRDEEKPVRSHSFTSDQIGETKEKILEVAAGIRNREFEAKTGFHCDWCDYKNLVCPAWEVG